MILVIIVLDQFENLKKKHNPLWSGWTELKMTECETHFAKWIVTTQWVVMSTDADTWLTKTYTRRCNNCIRQRGFQRKPRANSNPEWQPVHKCVLNIGMRIGMINEWRRLHRIRKLDEESNQLAQEQAIYKLTRLKRNIDSEQVRNSSQWQQGLPWEGSCYAKTWALLRMCYGTSKITTK